MNPGVEHVPLLECCPQRTVEAVLEIELATPPDHVREEVAVERRVLVEERVEVQRVLGGDQLVEPDLPGRQCRPLPRCEVVRRVRSPVAHPLEDHAGSLQRPPPVPARLDFTP